MKVQLIKKIDADGIGFIIRVDGKYFRSDTDLKEAKKKYDVTKQNLKLKPSEEILEEEIIEQV